MPPNIFECLRSSFPCLRTQCQTVLDLTTDGKLANDEWEEAGVTCKRFKVPDKDVRGGAGDAGKTQKRRSSRTGVKRSSFGVSVFPVRTCREQRPHRRLQGLPKTFLSNANCLERP